MPKKPSKNAKKRKVHTVKSILDELRAQMKVGLGSKKLTKAAKDYWETKHKKSVVDQGTADWDKDKKKALAVAIKLGLVAKVLQGSGDVELWAAEAAHVAVKDDPTCPTGPGSGGYCDF